MRKQLVRQSIISAGILGDRYERNGKSGSSKIAAGNTYIQNCFSVMARTQDSDRSIVSLLEMMLA